MIVGRSAFEEGGGETLVLPGSSLSSHLAPDAAASDSFCGGRSGEAEKPGAWSWWGALCSSPGFFLA